MGSTYFIRWLAGYGWLVTIASRPGIGDMIITGFGGDNVPLETVMAWCGPHRITILPTA